MKLALSVLFVVIAACSAHASVTIKIGSSGWGNSTTSATNGMIWGLVVDSTGASFAGTATSDLSAALLNFVIPATSSPSNPVQIGSSNYYFIEAQSTTSSSGPPTFTNGFMNTVQFNLAGTVGSGDAAGLLWFAEGTTTNGSHFGFQNLSQVLPPDASNITSGWGGAPGLASNTIGSVGPIPEPSRLMLLGLGAVGLVFRRRRV